MTSKKINPALKALQESADRTNYLYENPDSSVLEKFSAPTGKSSLSVKVEMLEFTSLCPITHQPDYGTIHIEYLPDEWCVESKSLKLYGGMWRQTGAFHESIVQKICDDLIEVINPRFIRVIGEFNSRGGISFHPIAEWSKEQLTDEYAEIPGSEASSEEVVPVPVEKVKH